MAANPKNWPRIKALFDAALELKPEERSHFLREISDEPEVCAEVKRLLTERERAGSFLSSPVLDEAVKEPPADTERINQGQILAGRFKITRFIAAGGMGEVYEAEDLEMREHVAIKTIRRDILQQPNAMLRFRREVQLARKVTHPNVCRVFDLFRHSPPGPELGAEVIFVTMELLRGCTLARRLREVGCLTTAEAFTIVEQITSALSAAHDVGVIHGDFKPSNVLLVPSQMERHRVRAVVTDFGLASKFPILDSDPPSTAESVKMHLAGTLIYMAPEQIEGKPATAASDIYALGLVIYEVVTGQHPFHGDTPLSIALKRLSEPPIPPSHFVRELNETWETAILRCLQREPTNRFARALDILAPLIEDFSKLNKGSANVQQQPRVLEAAAPRESSVGRATEVVAMVRHTDSRGLRGYLQTEAVSSVTPEDVRERPFLIEFTPDANGKLLPTEISLRLDSPDFEPRSQLKKLHVPPAGDSEACIFLVRPCIAGELVAILELLRGEEVVTSRLLRTRAVPEGAAVSPGLHVVAIPITIVVQDPLGRLVPQSLLPGEFTVFTSPSEAPSHSPAPPLTEEPFTQPSPRPQEAEHKRRGELEQERVHAREREQQRERERKEQEALERERIKAEAPAREKERAQEVERERERALARQREIEQARERQAAAKRQLEEAQRIRDEALRKEEQLRRVHEAARQLERERQRQEKVRKREESQRKQAAAAEKLRSEKEAQRLREEERRREGSRLQQEAAAKTSGAKLGPVAVPETAREAPAGRDEPRLEKERVTHFPFSFAGSAVVLLLAVGITWKALHHHTMTIQVATTPEGAAVTLSSLNKTGAKQECVTPHCDLDVASGTYTLEIRHEGFEPSQRTVEVSAHGQRVFPVTLVPVAPISLASSNPPPQEPARLEVRGLRAGTELFVGGKSMGKVGHNGEISATVSAGDYEIKLMAKNQNPIVLSRHLDAGRVVSLGGDDLYPKTSSPPGSQPAPENAEWQGAQGSRTIESVEQFLRKYPNGTHSTEAREMLENLYWVKDSQANTVDAYREYLRVFPRGLHAASAEEEIEFLEAKDRRDPVALDAFLSEYPESKHSGAVDDLRENVAWERTNKGDEKSLDAYLTAFPKGRHFDDVRKQVAQLQASSRPAPTNPGVIPQPPSIDESRAVLDVLARYKKAYEDENIVDLQSIWPGMPRKSVGEAQEFFKSARNIHLDYGLPEPEIRGDQAIVKFSQSLTCDLDRKPMKTTSGVTMQLRRKAPGTWLIESIQ